ncbi:MAG: class I SAM-dependent methyltransferase [Pseudomonadales bacterium]|nr:class I SAM-dependent methyltransferase [Pseudomonadales bacterium]
MGLYEKYLLPKLLNMAMKSPDMTRIREQLVPLAGGKVLELGVGSGLNLPFYRAGTKVTGVDPSLELQAYAREVAHKHRVDVEFVAQSAESLDFADNSFDSVVVTWTLCTIPDPAAALAEVRRVLKPSGKLIFAEHGQAPEPHVVKWQNRINPVWRHVGGGCNLNRRPDETMTQTGFTFDDLATGYITGPKWATYTYQGVARIA